MTYRVHRDVDLTEANTLALPSRAECLLEIFSDEDLTQAIADLNLTPESVLVLGSGSNVLLPERVTRTVLRLKNDDFRVLTETDSSLTLAVGAGMIWDDLVQRCVANTWYGLENLSLIPGTVGAAPVQNIGAYGVELCDVLESVRTYDFQRGGFRTLTAAECCFAYRDSLFKSEPGRFVITQVLLRLGRSAVFTLDYGDLQTLSAEADVTLAQVRAAVCALREAKLPNPSVLPNVGSFFKNPLVDATKWTTLRAEFPGLVSYPLADGRFKLAAAWLIESAGWKGRNLGPVGVHHQQALVLVNRGGATLSDLQALSASVRASVQLKFGVELEQEPVWVAG